MCREGRRPGDLRSPVDRLLEAIHYIFHDLKDPDTPRALVVDGHSDGMLKFSWSMDSL